LADASAVACRCGECRSALMWSRSVMISRLPHDRTVSETRTRPRSSPMRCRYASARAASTTSTWLAQELGAEPIIDADAADEQPFEHQETDPIRDAIGSLPGPMSASDPDGPSDALAVTNSPPAPASVSAGSPVTAGTTTLRTASAASSNRVALRRGFVAAQRAKACTRRSPPAPCSAGPSSLRPSRAVAASQQSDAGSRILPRTELDSGCLLGDARRDDHWAGGVSDDCGGDAAKQRATHGPVRA
jgi:hypothetical protein